MSGFPPRPGTVAYRVLAYLETLLPGRPRGTAGMVAGELRGVTALQVRDALEAAHEAGYVNREAEFGPGGRGPVFYELVRTTTGALAVGGGEPREVCVAPAHAGGVVEPVVDPNPPQAEAAPDRELERHRGVFTSELDAWLHARHGAADPVEDHAAVPAAAQPVVAAAAAPVHVALDFAAPGTDQFAVALASDGRLLCWRGVVPYVFSRAEARALIDYLNRIDLAPLLEEGAA